MTVPFVKVEVRGSHRAIGRALGEAARPQVEAAVAYYRENLAGMSEFSFDAAESLSLRYAAAARRVLPKLVDELEGLAEGAGVPFGALAVLNCGEELTCVGDPAAHCTTVAMAAAGRVVAAHNEDWYAGDVANNVLMDVTVPDGTRFLAMSAAGYLGATGISSHGIASGANTVYSGDVRIRVPNMVVRRWVLEARSLPEAVERACLPQRARGSNHLFASADGSIVDVETSATAFAVIQAEAHGGGASWTAHTNHYLDDSMKGHELSTWEGSRRRLARARALVVDGLARGDDPADIAARTLCDHDGDPLCICAHVDESLPPAEREMTCASQVWDLEAMTMDVCAGPPCENPYRRYRLG